MALAGVPAGEDFMILSGIRSGDHGVRAGDQVGVQAGVPDGPLMADLDSVLDMDMADGITHITTTDFTHITTII
ncbi:hypothetical protein GCM10023115_43350 [Pontixanthobacter gangjinensis]